MSTVFRKCLTFFELRVQNCSISKPLSQQHKNSNGLKKLDDLCFLVIIWKSRHWLFHMVFYNCSQAVKCGNKSGCRIDLRFMVLRPFQFDAKCNQTPSQLLLLMIVSLLPPPKQGEERTLTNIARGP